VCGLKSSRYISDRLFVTIALYLLTSLLICPSLISLTAPLNASVVRSSTLTIFTHTILGRRAFYTGKVLGSCRRSLHTLFSVFVRAFILNRPLHAEFVSPLAMTSGRDKISLSSKIVSASLFFPSRTMLSEVANSADHHL
jgi:hypothetical protein